MANHNVKAKLEEDLRLIPGTFSVHVMLDKRKFTEADKERLVGAIQDVVYAMKVQNIGHYPLEFDAHNAHVIVRKHLASHGDRIKVAYAR